MTRRTKSEEASGFTIMLVDDNADYLQATRLLLERDGHDVITATNGREALSLLPKQRVDLLLLDYFMPGITGEQVVTEIRKFDPYIQVILQTGYSSEQPPQEMLRRLDIQGYYDKTEGPERLLLWTAVGLKAARTIRQLTKSREGLERILSATPDLHRVQPLSDLMRDVLSFSIRLVTQMGPGGVTLPPSEPPDSFGAVLDGAGSLVVMAGTGQFDRAMFEAELDPEIVRAIHDAIERRALYRGSECTVVPLRAGVLTMGALFVQRGGFADPALDLLGVFANQAAVAIQNARLFELVSVDAKTGLYGRSFFDEWLVRSVASAVRWRHAVGVLLCTLGGASVLPTKDQAEALEAAGVRFGTNLRSIVRAGDLAARIGPSQFAVIVAQASHESLAGLAHRLAPVASPEVQCDVAFAWLDAPTFSDEQVRSLPSDYCKSAATALLQRARQVLGENAREAEPWPTFHEASEALASPP